MRFVNISGRRKFEDDLSAPSSVQSVESCEVFGSPVSDLSDCEYCVERRQRYRKHFHSPNTSGSTNTALSYHSVMDRLEATPLLANSPPDYKTNLHDSSDTLGPAELSDNTIISAYKKRFETPQKSGKRTQSSLVTIFSVWNTIMGSSLLTMAWGVERAGLPAALVLVAFMSALCLYTAYILLRVNSLHGGEDCEVPALCGALLGGAARALAHAFSLLVLLGANIVYWILITNFLYYTVNYFSDLSSQNSTYNTSLLCPNQEPAGDSLITPQHVHDSAYWGLHTTVPVYVAIIIFPLLNFKNVSFFTKFNSLGTLSVAYLVVFVVVKGWSWGVHVASLAADTHPARNAAVLSGMLALSFYIHNIIISIMSNNARQDKNGRDLTIAFVLVTVTYVLVGAVFYICFPLAKSCIEDNILNNFEMHDVMTALARILLLFQVVTVYPLVAFMLRSELALLVPAARGAGRGVLVNLAIVAVCILAACLCPNIGTIIRYTGAVSGLVHVFALPSLLEMKSLQVRGRLTWGKTIFYVAIIVFGAGNLIMQFFITG